MLKKDLIIIREMTELDRNFIYSTWLDSVYFGNDLYKLIDKIQFKNKYKQMIYKIMEKPETKVKISCLKDDQDVILGYSVSEEAILHFVYVKAAWRQIGIAKDLIPQFEAISIYSPFTDIGSGIIGQKCKSIRVIPY